MSRGLMVRTLSW